MNIFENFLDIYREKSRAMCAYFFFLIDKQIETIREDEKKDEKNKILKSKSLHEAKFSFSLKILPQDSIQ